jgi:hypothetical protein
MYPALGESQTELGKEGDDEVGEGSRHEHELVHGRGRERLYGAPHRSPSGRKSGTSMFEGSIVSRSSETKGTSWALISIFSASIV